MKNLDLKKYTKAIYCLTFIVLLISNKGVAQVDEDQLGAWYMYFWNTTIKESQWGFQGDVQFRNWDFGGDLEQLLLRGGVTFKPRDTNIKFTLGYGHITTGDFGTEEDGTVTESRIYQEALFPQKISNRFYLTHRFRYEQRFVEEQDLRTRYRYNLFVNVALNSKDINPGTIYLALYNEMFINGEKKISDDKSVEIFDRNRSYAAVGYVIKEGMKVQLGIMQQTTNNWKKNQAQLSLHHTF